MAHLNIFAIPLASQTPCVTKSRKQAMAFDNKILHSVRGVMDLKFTGEGESMVAVAKTGVGLITIISKPTVPFGNGVVGIDPAIGGRDLCDDAQLVAAFVRAYQGYNPFFGNDGKEWAGKHIAQGETELDPEDYPLDNFIELDDDEARAYLFDHGIFHPGTPI